MRKLFRDEINIMMGINHPRILKCHDVHKVNNGKRIRIVMDYCEGGNL